MDFQSAQQHYAPESFATAAETCFLSPSGLQIQTLWNILSETSLSGIDFADLFFQYNRSESWSLEEGMVKSASHHISSGMGARVCSGEKMGFAYTEDLSEAALRQAAQASCAMFSSAERLPPRPPSQGSSSVSRLYGPIDPLASWSSEAKVDYLMRLDQQARAKDPRVEQVFATLVGCYEVVMILNSEGTLAFDVRPLVRANIRVVVAHQGQREEGYAGFGGRLSYDALGSADLCEAHVDHAVRQALLGLEAVPAPAGVMPVVLGPGWPGVLLHEAVGHGLEGDFNRKGTSAFSGRLGEVVASELCTVVDDGTLAGRRGSLSIDDEGTPTQCTVLIEQGVLKGYLQDRHNARLMGMAPTGNGRRESYAFLPMPRMTNTYMLPGSHRHEEIIESVEKGIYAANFDGGQVDITSGKFVFSANEAYWIEKGRLGKPIKGATLIGDGPEVLRRVSMVGNNLALDTGIGVCGKDGQSVPVGVGQPTLKIDAMTVGGTALDEAV